MSQTAAESVYLQLVDYLDGDTTTVKEGAETDAWAGVVPARQPANQMMRTIAEIKLLPAPCVSLSESEQAVMCFAGLCQQGGCEYP